LKGLFINSIEVIILCEILKKNFYLKRFALCVTARLAGEKNGKRCGMMLNIAVINAE